ncbi:tripartite-type tricarboxylate transporter receptor subunit TctC [Variovorax boronicumulans]|uniref:tripartite tricarboxylate transporter substrate binding protein n=1 Tax=Variovorax boronicumulans TaxID=436515 RepID=UPI002780712C|nr:tripartite tricarboxylate transporter substrate-binding protein [Variovorax boronicumulans]MDQ0037840.1 tripartite-type tricarboxylate transporter receptor subunit TctC [Variovorax boronicumulans]
MNHQDHLATRRQLCKALAASLLPAAWPAFAADADWPSRPIKWVLPYLAGTGPDNTARALAEAVGTLLGQPVVIENRGGAAGNIGARLVARAPADGYTWIYSAAPMAANMRMYANPGYDAIKDFRHIMRLTTSDILLIVHPSSGIDTVRDLIERTRANPGKLDYASGGVGTPSHLGMELFLSAAGVQAMHVPYKGASELVNAVLGKQVLFAMPIFSVAHPHVQAGRLKALAVAGSQRNPALPELPTLAEAGVPGVSLTSWGGISVPARTPDPIVAKIHAAFEEALRQPAVRTIIEVSGGSVSPSSSQEYAKGFVQEIALTETMMKKAQLAPM